jgi:hypothetical protein
MKKAEKLLHEIKSKKRGSAVIDKLSEVLKIKARNRFCRNSDCWEITFNGKRLKPIAGSYRGRSLKGMEDYAYLLANERKPVTASSLFIRNAKYEDSNYDSHTVTDALFNEILHQDQYEEEYLFESSEDTDAQNLQEKREEALQRLVEISKEGTERGEIAKKIIKTMGQEDQSELKKILENQRKAVTKRMAKAIEIIQKKSPELAKHLKDRVSKGYLIQYDPPEPMEWIVRF